MYRNQLNLNNANRCVNAAMSRVVLAGGISLFSLLSFVLLISLPTLYSHSATALPAQQYGSFVAPVMLGEEVSSNSAANTTPIRLWAAASAGSLGQAIRMAKRQYPGRVLSAKTRINRQGSAVYLIKILSKSGEIRTIVIPSSASSKRNA